MAVQGVSSAANLHPLPSSTTCTVESMSGPKRTLQDLGENYLQVRKKHQSTIAAEELELNLEAALMALHRHNLNTLAARWPARTSPSHAQIQLHLQAEPWCSLLQATHSDKRGLLAGCGCLQTVATFSMNSPKDCMLKKLTT